MNRRSAGWVRQVQCSALTASGAALICLLAPGTQATPPFTFREWTTRDGLPENQVTALAQTRDGYLWVGTEDGLARFDGVRFVNFGLQNGLRSTRIRSLYEDRDGSLWIGTIAGGLSRLDQGRMQTFGPNEGLPDSTINQVVEDSAGRLWVATRRGLAVREGGRFIVQALPEALQGSSILGLVPSRTGALWLTAYQGGLWRFQDGRLTREIGPTGPEDANDTYNRVWEDRAGRLWVCVGANLLFCRETNGWRRFSIPLDTSFPMLRSLAEEADGTLWAGSIRNGLYFVQDGELTRITTRDGLSENGIESLLVDREGNIWVGTIGGGLNRLTRKTVKAYGTEEGLRYPVVRGLAEVAPGELWVGTRGDGLYHWQDGRFRRIQLEGDFGAEIFVNSIVRAQDGSCWVAAGHGVYRFVNGQPEAHPDWRTTFRGETANVTLCEDGEGGMWAGSSEVLWHLSGGGKAKHPRLSPNRHIIAIAQDRDGAIWVGTEGDGLYRAVSNAVHHYKQSDGLGSDQVRVLRFDREGTLWIGTAGGGLTRLKDNRFFTVTARQGLPDDTVSQILEDNQGYLWIGGNRGIARIDKREVEELSLGGISTLFPTVLTMADGLLSEECTGTYSPAGLRMRSGELCFATLKGIVLVDPSDVLQGSPPPDVWLEEILVDGERQTAGLLPPADPETSARTPPLASTLPREPEPLTIAPGKHRLEFHYTGLNFAAPERVRFRYRLEGLDRSWVEAGTRRTAYYNYIPPGRYHFRVIACNKDGIWNEAGASIALTVQPFLWQRPWFTVALTLLAMGGLAATILSVERRRQRREHERLATEHAVERERTRIAKDIHDDLGATLSEIQLLSRFAQTPESPPDRVREDVRQIAEKAVGSMQALDEIVWAVDPQSDSLESFVNYACAFATEYLALAKVRCRLDLPVDIPPHTLRADMRYNLFLAFKESLTNLVKHATATEARIALKAANGLLTVSVTDNGKGIAPPSPAQEPGHDGLMNMRSRVAAIGGTFHLSSSPGSGTTVRFEVPL